MQVTNEGLLQGYVVVPCAKRFIVLYSFLKRHQSKKVMVFFSSCNSLKFIFFSSFSLRVIVAVALDSIVSGLCFRPCCAGFNCHIWIRLFQPLSGLQDTSCSLSRWFLDIKLLISIDSHFLRSPPIFYFSEEKGESSKKPYFLRDQKVRGLVTQREGTSTLNNWI